MKAIITDISNIAEIVSGRCIYVDKTAYLYKLITASSSLFFISRPRRFGKSLMLSTLQAIFEGRKELFEGLAISKTDYDWKPYPVLHFDLSTIRDDSVENMQVNLTRRVCDQAEQFGLSLDDTQTPGQAFDRLWKHIQKENLQVVVLIDEYDVPMQGYLGQPERLEQVRTMLHDFYVRLKGYSSNIRFLMMTGVSKFAKLSVFSGLNNLVDLSMDRAYAGMLGYTEEELDTYFREHIQAFADTQNISYDEMRAQLRQWYNGYHFSKDMTVGVYNPVSIGYALNHQELKDYWIQTGASTLIIERIREAQKIPANLDDFEISASELDEFDVKTMPWESLLYQGGYLTIKGVNDIGMLILGIPNLEVRSSLNFQYLQKVMGRDHRILYAAHMRAFMALSAGDYRRAIELFRTAIAELPYSWLVKDEGAVKVAFLSFFYPMPEVRISPEKEILNGKIDAVVETEAGVYIFEFKYNQSAQVAHDQVLEKGYANPYRSKGKPIFAIGLNYTPKGENRGIDEAVVSQV